jgi:hypothetical protein
MIEAIGSSETLVPLYQTTQRLVSEDSNLHGRRLFENRVLKKMLAPKAEEATGRLRQLRTGELHILYSYLVLLINQNKEAEVGRTYSTNG